MRRLLAEELLPTVPEVPGVDVDAYVEQMLERFANPRIGHRLEQIAAGAEHKIPQRLLPSARELRAGREPVLIEHVVAAAGLRRHREARRRAQRVAQRPRGPRPWRRRRPARRSAPTR